MDKTELHFTADVLKDGKITIPLTVRKALGIQEGDIVALTIHKFMDRVKQIGDQVEKPEGLD